jgi:hypothetical protein
LHAKWEADREDAKNFLKLFAEELEKLNRIVKGGR